MRFRKARKALLIVSASIITLFCLAGMGYFLYANEVRFDYCDASVYVDTPELELLLENGCKMVYPFFGNSTSLSEGRHYAYPLGIGSDKAPIYANVNSTIHAWAKEITNRYQNQVKINYKVENNGKRLTVNMNGFAYPNGLDKTPIEITKTFVFDIENASLKKLPVLISET